MVFTKRVEKGTELNALTEEVEGRCRNDVTGNLRASKSNLFAMFFQQIKI
jgi:hypothetical protein